MSKKILVLCLALGVLATSNAFASRARNLVMGTGDAGAILGTTGNNGSFYFDDAYNSFYNPSYVNDFKNWGIIEKANVPGNTAMGGMVASMMNFNIGAYFNRVGGINGTYSDSANMRPIDLMVGADMGVKWGLGATIASKKVGDTSDSDLTLRAGAQFMDLDPFVAFKILGKNQLSTPGAEPKNKEMTAGVRYHFGEWIPYAAYTTRKIEDLKTYTAYGFGLGRNTKMMENASMMYAIGYWQANLHQTTGVRRVIPINVAVEGNAMSWLTLRAGLGYQLMDQTGGNSALDSATGRIGATAHLGKVDMDFAVGQSAAVSNVGDGAIGNEQGGVKNAMDTQTLGLNPGFFTAASVGYHW